MKKLCLFRHAKSTYGALGTEDLDRPLHPVGLQDAPLMANILKSSYKFKPDLILTSHAQRTLLTAESICAALGYNKEKIRVEKSLYEAGVEDLLEDIKLIDSKVKNLLIVGHNPGLTLLANFLVDTHVTNLPTCGVVAIEFDTNSWDNISAATSKLLFFDEPKNHQ